MEILIYENFDRNVLFLLNKKKKKEKSENLLQLSYKVGTFNITVHFYPFVLIMVSQLQVGDSLSSQNGQICIRLEDFTTEIVHSIMSSLS